MKKRLSIIILFIVIPFALFSQEQKVDNFRFIDVGIGASHGLESHGVFNVAITNSLGNVIANFIDYNMAIGSPGVLFHEINFKLGPYYRFNKYSYIAVSTGMSFIYNSKPDGEYDYDGYFGRVSYEDKYLLSIPIQGKLNIDLNSKFCIGLKGTYNKMFDTNAKDKTTVLIYLALGF